MINNTLYTWTTGGGFSAFAPRPSYQDAAVEQWLSSNAIIPPQKFFNSSNRGYPGMTFFDKLFEQTKLTNDRHCRSWKQNPYHPIGSCRGDRRNVCIYPNHCSYYVAPQRLSLPTRQTKLGVCSLNLSPS